MLSVAACRVLGVLVEKQATVPDSYPLSLNALVAGCNQKTAREPVMALADAEVLQALDELKARSLVVESSGNRVVRFEHNAPRALRLPGAAVALLALLMLRGPQTAAELRLHTERLHRFADISSVEAFLQELAEHDPPQVVKLARAPGARESRWAHLLAGEVGLAAADDASPDQTAPARREPPDGVSAGDFAALQAEVAALRRLVEAMATELGLDTAALPR
ncbi:YceH family protein [Aquabacterium sp. J223]|uniref:YceH family protein n=1 Tax=Aquabacterium sp. J223 TaxID=2898431 RepID=UPI0021AD528E|nr:YceH family protein [Aquabacterium sp. J223]UUX97059.1 YceH family protein [Aquabacterium sp. J223]